MKKLTAILIFSLCTVGLSSASAQLNSYSFNQLDSLTKTANKPMVVFIHTDWCRYCKAMNYTTFRNEDVVKKLNSSYYFIKLNAEVKAPINFAGTTYKFEPTGNGTGVNELARQIGEINGNLNFPTVVFLNEKFEIVYRYVGFMNARQFLTSLEILEKGNDHSN